MAPHVAELAPMAVTALFEFVPEHRVQNPLRSVRKALETR